ncbi:MAG: hypothetical protein WD176_06245, partial [Pirellulales bacterium]
PRLITLAAGFSLTRSLAAIARPMLIDLAESSQATTRGGADAMPDSDQRGAREVFIVHHPLGERETTREIWNDVDEQELPPTVRRKLAQHGFRVGVSGSELPPAVQELLAASGNTTAADHSDPEGSGAQPMASRQELRLRPGSRGEIVPSPVHERLTVITCDDREVSGKTYYTAQGRLAIRCQPQGDGRVQVEVVPQLIHGQPRRRFVGDDGVLRFETGQPKVVFDALKIAPTLSPGQMLLIGCAEEPLSSLGRDFLCDTTSGKPIQKLLILRLAHSAYDDSLGDSPGDALADAPGTASR